MAEAKMATVTVLADRAAYTTRKYRAEDLVPGDVTRNRYGKWDVVVDVDATDGDNYVGVTFQVGGTVQMRTVHLVDVQAVKPS